MIFMQWGGEMETHDWGDYDTGMTNEVASVELC